MRGAGRRYTPRLGPCLERAFPRSRGIECLTNGLRICECGGGKWGECVWSSHKAVLLLPTPRGWPQKGCSPILIPSPTCRAPMKLLALLSLLALMLQEAGTASLPEKERERGEDRLHRESDSSTALHLGDYTLSPDSHDGVLDLSNYEELTDYGDQLPKVRDMQQRTAFPATNRARGSSPPTPEHRCLKPPSFSRR